MMGWSTRLSSARRDARHWKILFWGMMKAFFWQSLKQAKSSSGVGWNSRAYPVFCVLSCCLRRLSLRLLSNTTLRYLGWPYFNSKIHSKTSDCCYFPTLASFERLHGDMVRKCEECPTFRYLQPHSAHRLICRQHTQFSFFIDRKSDYEMLQVNIAQ